MATAPRLTQERINIALKLLDGWTGKLTWSRFLAMLEVDIGHKYTKAALLRHTQFKNSWDTRRWDNNSNPPEYTTTNYGLKASLQKIENLEATIKRLENENCLLIEKFVIWSTNAANKGITMEELNKPIPTNSTKNFR